MLYCQLILLKGEGNATLAIRTQPHIDTHVVYTLRGLPLGGTLLIGDGTTRQALAIGQTKGEAVLPPLDTMTLWAAYLAPDARCLAWGTADGRWREYVAAHLHAWEEERRSEPKVEEPSVDLADFGVVAVETDRGEAQESAPTAANRAEETEATIEVQTENEAPVDEPISACKTDEHDAVDDTSPSCEGESDAAPSEAQPFFTEDVARLATALDEYPQYEPLMQLVEGSRWVEVNGGKEDAYLLGLLYDSTPAPTHLVYGVRGQRNRPFAEDAEWLAASDDTSGEGYWLIYHNL